MSFFNWYLKILKVRPSPPPPHNKIFRLNPIFHSGGTSQKRGQFNLLNRGKRLVEVSCRSKTSERALLSEGFQTSVCPPVKEQL